MKIIKKNVYYCDFCNKKSLSSLKRHEKKCTGNPNRECNLCKDSEGKKLHLVIKELLKRFKIIEIFEEENISEQVKWIGKKITVEEIFEKADNCPNCILNIIRCVGLNRYYFNDEYKYNYMIELEEYWKEENQRQKEIEESQTY